MTTPSQGDPSTNIAIPLTPDVRAAYQDLYVKIQAEIDGTMDAVAVDALNAAQPQVADVLDRDDLFRVGQNTALFDGLRDQIKDANDSLRTLKAQIESTVSHFATAADIIAAIDKVMTLVPGL